MVFLWLLGHPRGTPGDQTEGHPFLPRGLLGSSPCLGVSSGGRTLGCYQGLLEPVCTMSLSVKDQKICPQAVTLPVA